MISLRRALAYPFAGPDSLSRGVLGALLILLAVPTLGLSLILLLGYQRRLIQAVMAGEPNPPPWTHLFADAGPGLVMFLGTLLYYLPSAILSGVAGRMLWRALSGAFEGVDLIALAQREESLSFAAIDWPLIALLVALALLWLVLSAPLIMAATVRYAETGRASAFTNLPAVLRDVWRERRTTGAVMLNVFALVVLVQVLNTLLAITCLIGAYLQFVQLMAFSHLAGQYGARLQASRPKPSVIRPLRPLRR